MIRFKISIPNGTTIADLTVVLQVVWKDVQESLSHGKHLFGVKNLFGEEILDQMLDSRNKTLLAQVATDPEDSPVAEDLAWAGGRGGDLNSSTFL